MLEEELGMIGLDMQDYGFMTFEDQTQSLIDDLMENEFAIHNTGSSEFSVTFVFNKRDEKQIKEYISKNGKDAIVEQILKFTKGE